MALSTARIHRVRGRPPLLAAGIKSLIHSHSSSVRSLGYIFSFIYPFYTTREDFSDRLSGIPAPMLNDLRELVDWWRARREALQHAQDASRKTECVTFQVEQLTQ